MTAAQQTDARSMYPRDPGRVPRSIGARTVLAAALLAAGVPAVLWAATRPAVGATLLAVAVAVGARHAATRLRGRERVRPSSRSGVDRGSAGAGGSG